MGSGLPKSCGKILLPPGSLKISPENQRFDPKVEVWPSSRALCIFSLLVSSCDSKPTLTIVTVFSLKAMKTTWSMSKQQQCVTMPSFQQECWNWSVLNLCYPYLFQCWWLLTCRFSIIPEQIPRSFLVEIQGNYESHWIQAAVERDLCVQKTSGHSWCVLHVHVRLKHPTGSQPWENCFN